MHRASKEQIWEKLLRGDSLDGCGFPVREGRVVVQGLSLPDPEQLERYRFSTVQVTQLGRTVKVSGVRWKSLDFTDSKLPSLRFVGCGIDDCCFKGASCRDWRLWDTTITRTRFDGVDLRDSALGPVDDGRRNAFRQVVFENSDLRGTSYQSCDFEDCSFIDCNLRKVEFQGAVFRRCVFVGKLDEVIFQKHAFQGEAYPPNRMEGVDFSRATFRLVAFRNLELEQVRWPESDDYVIVEDIKAALQRGIGFLEGRTDLPAKVIRGLLQYQLKWTGANQRTGMINRSDLARDGRAELAGEVIRVMLGRGT